MSEKIKQNHIERKAILYVRQSSAYQVQNNLESQKLQYAMQDRLRHLGWQEIEIVDEDLGRTASGAVTRAGFERMVAEVCLGHVGAVAAREVSRFARNSREWQKLVEVCRIVDTVLIDQEMVYAPRLSNDRLLLGLKRPGSYCTSCSTFSAVEGKERARYPLASAPLFVPHQSVPPTNITYMLGIEMASESGAVAVGIQLLGNIRIAGVARQLMNPRHGVWRSFQ